jgi:hypothetical protein
MTYKRTCSTAVMIRKHYGDSTSFLIILLSCFTTLVLLSYIRVDIPLSIEKLQNSCSATYTSAPSGIVCIKPNIRIRLMMDCERRRQMPRYLGSEAFEYDSDEVGEKLPLCHCLDIIRRYFGHLAAYLLGAVRLWRGS